MSLKRIIVEGELIGVTGFSECLLDVSSPLEAIHALGCQIEGFNEFLENSELCYRCLVDGEEATLDQLAQGFTETLVIIPVPSGSNGLGNFIGGALLLGAAFAFPGGILGVSALGLGAVGAGMLARGVMGLLSPTPKPKDSKDTEGEGSHLFDRSSNPTKEGQGLPLLIGTFRIEPRLVFSSSIRSYRVDL